jgi:hypothetical protein
VNLEIHPLQRFVHVLFVAARRERHRWPTGWLWGSGG